MRYERRESEEKNGKWREEGNIGLSGSIKEKGRREKR